MITPWNNFWNETWFLVNIIFFQLKRLQVGKLSKDTWIPHASQGSFEQIIQDSGGFVWGGVLPFSASFFIMLL